MSDQAILFLLLFFVFVFLIWGRWRYDLVAFSALLIAVVVVIVVLDVIVEGYEVSPPVLVPLLLTAAGLLSVDLPRVRP